MLCLDEELSKVTSAAKADNDSSFTAGLKACSTPWNQKSITVPAPPHEGCGNLESAPPS